MRTTMLIAVTTILISSVSCKTDMEVAHTTENPEAAK